MIIFCLIRSRNFAITCEFIPPFHATCHFRQCNIFWRIRNSFSNRAHILLSLSVELIFPLEDAVYNEGVSAKETKEERKKISRIRVLGFNGVEGESFVWAQSALAAILRPLVAAFRENSQSDKEEWETGENTLDGMTERIKSVREMKCCRKLIREREKEREIERGRERAEWGRSVCQKL